MRNLVITLSFAGVVVACDKKEPTPTPVAEAKTAEVAAASSPGTATAKGPAVAVAKKAVAKAPTSAKAVGPQVGNKAPDFELKDTDGKVVKLSSFLGKTVVVEWFNPDCPFVKYAYTDGPLKTQAKRVVNDDIVWLNINSSAPGKQGHGVERNQKALKDNGLSRAVLIDEDGKIGRLYGAKTTPQMFVINSKGLVAYSGAIDNAPFGNVKGGGDVVNYVDQALASMAAGKAVATSETKPYGCSVKYR